jgi:hypothetical protein
VGNFLNFDTLISTSLIKAIYVLVQLMLVPVSFQFFESMGSTAPTSFLIGCMTLIVLSMVWRLICEGVILFFKIHETLNQLPGNIGLEWRFQAEKLNHIKQNQEPESTSRSSADQPARKNIETVPGIDGETLTKAAPTKRTIQKLDVEDLDGIPGIDTGVE